MIDFLTPRNIRHFKASVQLVCMLCQARLVEEMTRIIASLSRHLSPIASHEATEGLQRVLVSLDGVSEVGVRERALLSLAESLGALGPRFLRIWFDTMLRRVRVCMLEMPRSEQKIQLILSDLKKSCTQADGNSDDIAGKGSFLLELYSLELEYVSSSTSLSDQPLNVRREVKSILGRCSAAHSAVCSPKARGLIREYSGRTLLLERCFTGAYNEFFEGFRYLVDSGNREGATRLLHFTILASMLSRSQINPLDAREVCVFARSEECFNSLYELGNAYKRKDINAISSLLDNALFKTDKDFSHAVEYLIDDLWDDEILTTCDCYASIPLSRLIERTNDSWTLQTAKNRVIRLILDRKLNALLNENCTLVMVTDHQDARLNHLRTLRHIVQLMEPQTTIRRLVEFTV